MWALTSYRHMSGVASGRTPAGKTRKRGRGREASPGLMERMEERWRRRQERDDRGR
jgi:hypothetical protein